MIYGTVLCLGDSLTFGARAPLGFPEHLGPLLSARSGAEWVALNRGISGQTTREVLDRTPAAVGHLQSLGGAKYVTVLAGTNDGKGGGLDHALWEALYRQILHWPRRHGIPIAVMTFPPIRPGQMGAFPRESRHWLREASRRVRAIAAELHNRPSPIRVVELEDLSEEFLADGVHLTPSGYRIVAERVADVLMDDHREVPELAESLVSVTPALRVADGPDPAPVRRKAKAKRGAR